MSDEMPPPPPPPPPPGYAAQPPTGPRPGELLDRFLARLIDGIIIAVVYFVLAAIVAVIIRSGLLRGVIDAVLSAALYLGYFAYMESSQGKTIGKSVLKLRVLGPAGGNPTMEQAIRRNIWTAFGIAGIIPILGAVIGAVATRALGVARRGDCLILACASRAASFRASGCGDEARCR